MLCDRHKELSSQLEAPRLQEMLPFIPELASGKTNAPLFPEVQKASLNAKSRLSTKEQYSSNFFMHVSHQKSCLHAVFDSLGLG